MKYTKSQIRRLINEEIGSYATSKKYERVADEAFDDNDATAIHIQVMANLAENLILRIENDPGVDRKAAQKMLRAFGNIRFYANMLKSE